MTRVPAATFKQKKKKKKRSWYNGIVSIKITFLRKLCTVI